MELVDSIPDHRLTEAGVWGDGWSVRDLLAHLSEWEQMFLGWFQTGLDGSRPALPAPGYKWNQTPELNREVRRRFRDTPTPDVLERFRSSYDEIVRLARRLPEEDLLRPGRFAWTGDHPLATYLVPNTCSHYRVARKILKRWLAGHVRG